eukprot:CAMPEP_0194523352 /NCGR_PEP_ID=MMETSP0253-20130528/58212_1 /TAXON_ID=2966 /ORGANISM="Noctiluca scintillans" /LENGTH=508 /DNA_ID=CAMNT_0039367883 /DNA_START=13 /DNA_END=1539 /DNA_ORIENTATION=+
MDNSASVESATFALSPGSHVWREGNVGVQHHGVFVGRFVLRDQVIFWDDSQLESVVNSTEVPGGFKITRTPLSDFCEAKSQTLSGIVASKTVLSVYVRAYQNRARSNLESVRAALSCLGQAFPYGPSSTNPEVFPLWCIASATTFESVQDRECLFPSAALWALAHEELVLAAATSASERANKRLGANLTTSDNSLAISVTKSLIEEAKTIAEKLGEVSEGKSHLRASGEFLEVPSPEGGWPVGDFAEGEDNQVIEDADVAAPADEVALEGRAEADHLAEPQTELADPETQPCEEETLTGNVDSSLAAAGKALADGVMAARSREVLRAAKERARQGASSAVVVHDSCPLTQRSARNKCVISLPSSGGEARAVPPKEYAIQLAQPQMLVCLFEQEIDVSNRLGPTKFETLVVGGFYKVMVHRTSSWKEGYSEAEIKLTSPVGEELQSFGRHNTARYGPYCQGVEVSDHSVLTVMVYQRHQFESLVAATTKVRLALFRLEFPPCGSTDTPA